MTVVFDFSKETNDYRQRIAIIFKSLFEREFLENFDIILGELFNGHYSVKDLKEAIRNSKHILLEVENMNPIVKKKRENDNFANDAIRVIILAMMLGEEYIKLKDILSGIESRENVEDTLSVINDIVGEMIKTKVTLKDSLTKTGFDIAQRSRVNEVLHSMDDVIVECCFNLRVIVIDEILSLSDIDDVCKELGESIVERSSVVIGGKEKTIGF